MNDDDEQFGIAVPLDPNPVMDTQTFPFVPDDPYKDAAHVEALAYNGVHTAPK